LDSSGNAYVEGQTSSTNFPTLNPLQPAYAGKGDAFVAKFGASPPPPTYTISGTVRLGNAGLAGVTLSAGGRRAVTAADGTYQIRGLTAGTYTVTPSLAEYTF